MERLSCQTANHLRNNENKIYDFSEGIHENESAKKHIQSFHRSMKMTIKECCICHEAWPVRSKTESLKNEKRVPQMQNRQETPQKI